MQKILFVCIHNSGRSRMAEEFLNAYGADKATADSAGTAPGSDVNPTVAEAMAELGFDLRRKKPQLLTPEMIAAADRVITMGCLKDEGVCPVTFTPSEDWGLPDPKGKDIAAVRQIRDDIRRRVMELVADIRD
ncbi:Protein-tyrosine phosphatase, low molecular weight [Dehalogenimonas lykanthroporepellens BL-DC-9]|nr:Protein-tyrosine phosphatase, low molecular weight [Dehalogenimonas lykanthroporepellens BL-DC-9]